MGKAKGALEAPQGVLRSVEGGKVLDVGPRVLGDPALEQAASRLLAPKRPEPWTPPQRTTFQDQYGATRPLPGAAGTEPPAFPSVQRLQELRKLSRSGLLDESHNAELQSVASVLQDSFSANPMHSPPDDWWQPAEARGRSLPKKHFLYKAAVAN